MPTRRSALRTICQPRRFANRTAAITGLVPHEIAYACPRCLHWHRAVATPDLLQTLSTIPEVGRTVMLDIRPDQEAA
jgi:hypothetical protein